MDQLINQNVWLRHLLFLFTLFAYCKLWKTRSYLLNLQYYNYWFSRLINVSNHLKGDKMLMTCLAKQMLFHFLQTQFYAILAYSITIFVSEDDLQRD